MKAFWQSLKSLYGIVSVLTLVIGSFGAFCVSVIIPSAPAWVTALVFAVSFIFGFLYGSFGAVNRADLEAKMAEIGAKAEVEKAYETERARVEAEAEVKRRNLADIAEAERRAKERRENDYFRSRIKSLEFDDKVLLWLIYSGNEYKVNNDKCLQDIDDILRTLETEDYIEPETVDFDVTAYRVTDECRSLIAANDDLFKNAREKSEDDLICRMF